MSFDAWIAEIEALVTFNVDAVRTAMLVVKLRCGEALTTRLNETRRVQALLRAVTHNVQRLPRLPANHRLRLPTA